VTRAELARHLGVAKPSVTRAVKVGRIRFDEDGKTDLEVASAQWRGEIPGPRDKAVGDGPSYDRSRAEKEAAQARLATLKADELEGLLVRADEVEAEWFRILRSLRDRLLGVPDRLAILVAAETDEHAVRVMLDAEIRESLSAVADGLESLESTDA
jgi:phage terminase Nu1 subunit (DNA packaging protein)